MARPLPRAIYTDEDMRWLLRSAERGGDLRQGVFLGAGLLAGLRLEEVVAHTFPDALDDPDFLFVRLSFGESRRVPRATWLTSHLEALRATSPGPYVLGGDRPLSRDVALHRWLRPVRNVHPGLIYHDLRRWCVDGVLSPECEVRLRAATEAGQPRPAGAEEETRSVQASALAERRLLQADQGAS